jgi:hypothetical protein
MAVVMRVGAQLDEKSAQKVADTAERTFNDAGNDGITWQDRHSAARALNIAATVLDQLWPRARDRKRYELADYPNVTTTVGTEDQ